MKSRANKGWIKELAKRPERAREKKPFVWDKAVVPKELPVGNATEYRLKEFKAVKKADSQLTDEFAAHVKKRNGKV